MPACLAVPTSRQSSRPMGWSKRKRANSDQSDSRDSEALSSPRPSSALFSSPPCSYSWESESEDEGGVVGKLQEKQQEASLMENQEVSGELSNQPESKRPRQNLPEAQPSPALNEGPAVQCNKSEKYAEFRRFALTIQNQIVYLRKIWDQGKRELAEQLLKSEQEKHKALEKQCAQLQEQLTAMSQENQKLKAELQLHKGTSSLSCGACWQFELDGHWEAFSPQGNEKMHVAYRAYLRGVPSSRHVIIDSGGADRVIDFQLMQQKHRKTQKIRRIRLWAGVPPNWTTGEADLLQQGDDLTSFYKEVTDQKIWDSIRNILQNTGHAWDTATLCSCMRTAEVKTVHRIENFSLWNRYKMRLTGMRQEHFRCDISVTSAELDLDSYSHKILGGYQQTFDCGQPLAADIDEKILLHGTSWDNANSIVREGFDHRTCQHAFYGAGVYFACAACKSHQYTCEQHKKCCGCKCERTLIIARVALGDSYIAAKTRPKERRPPARKDSSGTYDSIVVKPGPIQGHHQQEQIHQEFVIFDREQAYPCYVVQYTIQACS